MARINCSLPRSVPFFFVGLSCLGLIACGEEDVIVDSTSRPVKMFTVTSSGSGVSLNYPGRVIAAQRTELAFEVQGKITEFNYMVGQEVEQNAVIAQLDASDYQAQLDSVNSRLTAARSQLERIEELKESNFASEREVDEAARALDVLTAQSQQAEKAVADTSLRAPFDGRLASKLIEDFANVQAKQTIGLFQDISTLHVTVNVPQNDFRYVNSSQSMEERKEALTVSIAISSFPGREFEARFYEIATTADLQTGTFETTVEFPPPDDIVILPGMTATVSISIEQNTTDAEGIIKIPAEAVFSNSEGNSVVWIIDSQSNLASRKNISIGVLTGEDIEVLNGLNTGDVIATSGVHALTEGMLVTPYRSRSE